MKLLKLAILLFLFACNNTNNPRATIEFTMQVPEQFQNSRSIDYAAIEADVSFNGGPATVVSFTNSDSKQHPFNNLLLDADNAYEIKWFESIDGVRLQLSAQKGLFFADSTNTTGVLDAPHDLDFDFNHNRINNLDERKAGTCPWVTCNALGSLPNTSEIRFIEGFANSGFSMVRGSGATWIETSPDGTFNWIETGATGTVISLADSNRGHLLQIELYLGVVLFNFNNNPEDEFFELYLIRTAS